MSDEKLSTNQRVAIAFGLWLLFMVVWGFFFKPTPPQKPSTPSAASAPATPGTSPAAPAATGIAAPAGQPATAASPQAKAASGEQAFVVEDELYRVELSNRGGVVKSWQLKKYKDHAGKPLELVNAETAQQEAGWPFSLALADAGLESQVNSGLYLPSPPDGPARKLEEVAAVEGTGVQARVQRPVREISFEWSDGRLQVTKKFRFDPSYLVNLDTSVTLDGKPLAHAVAWRGGFGDRTEFNAADLAKVFYFLDNKLHTLEHKKLGLDDNRAQRKREEGTMRYAGIEDRYFAAAFLARGARPDELGPGLALWNWKTEREVTQGDSTKKEPVAEMAAGSTVEGPLALRVFVGPKALDELRALRPPLTELVQFGWLGLLAEPLFYFLKWIHKYVPNYGWAIILMTVAINMALFPLKVSSWRAMQKMQKLAPEMKQIQERYKKYGMTDPRRQKMNEETMALYKREGVNPYGSCLPMLLQMPIWIALYSMLNVAIELRHAPWHLWVKDLSSRDPYFILPLIMVATMWISQKMTPMTTADPAQQRMMNLMPIMFGVMFLVFPVSSGLVLYILSSTLIGIAQQWYLNKTAPAASAKDSRKK